MAIFPSAMTKAVIPARKTPRAPQSTQQMPSREMAHRRSQTIRMVSSGFNFIPVKTICCPRTSHCIGSRSFKGIMVSVPTSGSVTESLHPSVLHIPYYCHGYTTKSEDDTLISRQGLLARFSEDDTSQRFSTRVAGEVCSLLMKRQSQHRLLLELSFQKRFISCEVAPRK